MVKLQHIILAVCRYFREMGSTPKPHVYISPADYENICIEVERSDNKLTITTRKYKEVCGCKIVVNEDVPRGMFIIGFFEELETKGGMKNGEEKLQNDR